MPLQLSWRRSTFSFSPVSGYIFWLEASPATVCRTESYMN